MEVLQEQVLRENECWTIYFNKQERLLHFIYYPTSAKLTKKAYLAEVLEYVALIKKHKPQYILADTRQLMFLLTPDIQEWYAENVFAVYPTVGIERTAILVSEDLFAQVAVEQTMDEAPRTFENAYFHDEAEARAWLLQA